MSSISYDLKKLGGSIDIDELKEGQRKAINSFLEKKDALVILPTGHGKSLIYMTAPFCMDFLKHELECGCDKESRIQSHHIAIVVSPLIALMKDQVKTLKEKNVAAVYAGEMTQSEEKSLHDGKYSIVFASPETILGERGTELLTLPHYRQRVCAVFVDESHCIAKWGFKSGKVQAFRSCYSRLAELRSFLHSSTPMIALTATASNSVKSIVTSSLGLTNHVTIEESPDRRNIRYSVIDRCEGEKDQAKHFAWLTEDLQCKRVKVDKILIFCKTHRNARNLHIALTEELPTEIANMVALFSSVTEDSRKKYLLEEFVKEDGKIRVLLATSAFGMGINVYGLHTVINYGASRDIDDYFQESGRVGRDGKDSQALLFNFKGNFGKGKTDDNMQKYVNDRKTCRRKTLLSFCGHTCDPHQPPHKCCDVCWAGCECKGTGECVMDSGASEIEQRISRHGL